MTITLQGPSLLLNSYAFTGPFGGCGMTMDTTWNCPATTTTKDIVNWIKIACSQAPNKHLANVLLNFHGLPGKILVGEKTPEVFGGVGKGGAYKAAQYYVIDSINAQMFTSLASFNVGTIWLHSCNVAEGPDGKDMCKRMAVSGNVKVVAAVDTQYEPWDIVSAIYYGKGEFDDYEGKVYLWNEKGEMGLFNPNGGNWK